MAELPQAAYAAARRLGRKFLSDNASNAYRGYLPVLDDRLQGVEIDGEINLGLHEISLSKIVGTRTANRSNAFAGNFMPLLEEETEFGQKWIALYASHIKEGIREPIKVYEYINRYYVQEGNKRVSVLNFVGAQSMHANITRVLPRRDEGNTEVSIYYEFLDYDRREVFNNLWFSRRGAFTMLVRVAERLKEMLSAPESVPDIIRSMHNTFRVVYKRVAPDGLSLTTGDALLEYCRIFGPPYRHSQDEMAKNIRTAEAQFRQASGAAGHVFLEEDTVPESSSTWNVFSRKRKVVRAAFAFEGDAESFPWTRLHLVGIDRLRYKYGDRLEIDTAFNVPIDPRGCYAALSDLIAREPDVLFTASPSFAPSSLRVALENPGIVVLNCDRAREKSSLHTYYPKTQDAIFLCGVVAGAMSRRDKLGFMAFNAFRGERTYDVNAFALGARLVNPRAQVMYYMLKGADDYTEQNQACRKFLDFGADAAFVQHSYANPLSRKASPGVFAQLYLLHPKYGFPNECLGAAACDWFAFYDRIITSIFTGKSLLTGAVSGEAIHFGWGLDTGLVEVYGVDAFMGHNANRLLSIFRKAVASGQVHPFTGPVFDTQGNLRIEAYHTPTLAEIQVMDWYAEPIVKVM